MIDELKIVGHRVARLEGEEKVRGNGRYTVDIELPRMLHARLVRSVYPRATVRDVDVSAALAMPGVHTVLSSANVADRFPGLPSFDTAAHHEARDGAHPGDLRLFGPVVSYVGEPVAAVVADTDVLARDAARLVAVDYESLPAVLAPEVALRPDSPAVHEGAPRNVGVEIRRRIGEPDAQFAAARLVLEGRFTTSRQKHVQLEPTCCIADVTPGGGVTVWSPCQAPQRIRRALASIFDLPEHKVRVHTPLIGGAFGKGDALTAEPYVVALALLTRRPVKLRFSPQEEFVATDSRHSTSITLSAAFRADGTIAAVRAMALLDGGAYLSHSVPITVVLVRQLLGPYRIEHADIEGRVVFTNTPVSGAFRGYGGPQACFALEHVIDLGAERLGLDPVAVRDRMRLRAGDLWGHQRRPLVDDGLGACLRRGAEAFDWAAKRSSGPITMGSKRRGVGMACVSWQSGISDKPGVEDYSGAAVTVNGDGTVTLSSAGCDLGTGLRTALAQICAEEFGVPLDAVHVSDMDTDITPYDSGAHASRSLYRNGEAVRSAAADARRQVLDYAASKLGVAAAELDLRDGCLAVRGGSGRPMRLRELVRSALMDQRQFRGRGETTSVNAPPFAAQFAEVEVDMETGQVRVLRLLTSADVGRAINPVNVEGQLQGGAAQGLGFAVTEALLVDRESGATINGTWMGYRLPMAPHTPDLDIVLVGTPDPTGPFGAKGAGELGILPTAAAVANAVMHATGVSMLELPMTPERVLRALDHARAQVREPVAEPVAAT